MFQTAVPGGEELYRLWAATSVFIGRGQHRHVSGVVIGWDQILDTLGIPPRVDTWLVLPLWVPSWLAGHGSMVGGHPLPTTLCFLTPGLHHHHHHHKHRHLMSRPGNADLPFNGRFSSGSRMSVPPATFLGHFFTGAFTPVKC